MELDSLKDIWKEQDQHVDRHPDNSNEILSMLGKKSQSPVAKLRRNLRWELVAVIITYAFAIIYYLTEKHGRYWEVSILFTLVAVGFGFYYYHKDKLLKSMQCVESEVKSNLQHQLGTLEKYVRFYFIAGTLLMPFLYYLTGLIILYKTPSFQLSGETLGNRAQPMLNAVREHGLFTEFLIGGVVVTAGMYFLNKWYLNKLYGQHIKYLKDLLRQMDEI
ncbi:hypothetical protein HHL16_03490 [Pseudoflavitalea sp. G-6-1-2]|uniref:hypothetical protein n=1 Tax=Pseudoflavitalea sp. G-6-1-2 TaxID=2728841 RepID=UPI00146CF90D|nr:hypothetical protein [Pseudoflavitalea sp. G-6-1-2]NML19919.1 hypothetical protein [Pseudoflavitalea sp. G-6-1-2]